MSEKVKKTKAEKGNNLEAESLTMVSKDGTEWSTNSHITVRFQAADIIPSSSKPGLKSAGKIETDIEAFFTFLKLFYLETAVKYTNKILKVERVFQQSENSEETWNNNKHNYRDTDVHELKAFVGLLLLTSLYSFSLEGCWKNPFSSPHFAATMSFKRFLLLLTKIRFDDHSTRRERRNEDKFAALREVFDDFSANLSEYCNPQIPSQ